MQCAHERMSKRHAESTPATIRDVGYDSGHAAHRQHVLVENDGSRVRRRDLKTRAKCSCSPVRHILEAAESDGCENVRWCSVTMLMFEYAGPRVDRRQCRFSRVGFESGCVACVAKRYRSQTARLHWPYLFFLCQFSFLWSLIMTPVVSSMKYLSMTHFRLLVDLVTRVEGPDYACVLVCASFFVQYNCSSLSRALTVSMQHARTNYCTYDVSN